MNAPIWIPRIKYYIGFGVSKYKDSDLNLLYADKDARDLAETFSRMNREYNKIHIMTYLNEEVTVENIKGAKKILSTTKVDDTVILFIAGHGLHDTDKESTYYYLTYDADLENLPGTCANFELVEDLLQGIPGRKKLFLIDKCESKFIAGFLPVKADACTLTIDRTIPSS